MRTNLRFLSHAIMCIILSVTVLSACSDAPNEPVFPNTAPIIEAAFRDAFTRYVQDWSNYEFVTFARTSWIPYAESENELGDIDPSILHRLDDLRLPVRPFSECMVEASVSHPDFSGRGICIWIADITFTSRTSAVVYAGYFGDVMGAAGELYELRYDASRWNVARVRTIFVS